MSWEKPIEGAIDIGGDHWLSYKKWSPDRESNPQYAEMPDIPKFGAFIWHRVVGGDGGYHAGGVAFDSPGVQELMSMASFVPVGRAVWQVESWEPLTISPSVLCSCGDHGFIKNGKWVPA